MRRTAAAVFFASLMLSTSAFASGFALRDVSSSGLAVSYAGGAANGENASTLFFNPALLAEVGTFDISTSNIGLLPDTTADFTGKTAVGTDIPGDAHTDDVVNTALIGAVSLRYRLSPQWTIGMTATVPWGMITDYGNTSVARYHGTMSDVKSANFTPMVGWEPVPGVAFGAGLQVQYMKGRLAKAIDMGSLYNIYRSLYPTLVPANPAAVPGAVDSFVEMRAQAWSVGWMVGATWKPVETLTLGASFRSAVYNSLRGNEFFTAGPAPAAPALLAAMRTISGGAFVDTKASASIHNPPVMSLGAKWAATDRLTLLLGFDWTGWSIVQELVAHADNPKQPDDITAMNYKDSWFGSLGAQYRLTDDLRLSAGFGFDDTPTINETRTPRIPDGGRYWMSAGVNYKLTDTMDVDLTVARLIAEKGKINLTLADPTNATRGTLNGTVNLAVTMVGLQLNYHL